MSQHSDGKSWIEASKIIVLALLKRADLETVEELEAVLGKDVAPDIAAALTAARDRCSEIADGMCD